MTKKPGRPKSAPGKSQGAVTGITSFFEAFLPAAGIRGGIRNISSHVRNEPLPYNHLLRVEFRPQEKDSIPASFPSPPKVRQYLPESLGVRKRNYHARQAVQALPHYSSLTEGQIAMLKREGLLSPEGEPDVRKGLNVAEMLKALGDYTATYQPRGCMIAVEVYDQSDGMAVHEAVTLSNARSVKAAAYQATGECYTYAMRYPDSAIGAICIWVE